MRSSSSLALAWRSTSSRKSFAAALRSSSSPQSLTPALAGASSGRGWLACFSRSSRKLSAPAFFRMSSPQSFTLAPPRMIDSRFGAWVLARIPPATISRFGSITCMGCSISLPSPLSSIRLIIGPLVMGSICGVLSGRSSTIKSMPLAFKGARAGTRQAFRMGFILARTVTAIPLRSMASSFSTWPMTSSVPVLVLSVLFAVTTWPFLG